MSARILVLVAAAPLAISAVVADDIEKKTEATEAQFQSLDRDADHRISKAEASARKDLAQRFAAVDANSDGYLSADEFMARPSGERFE